MIAFLHTSKVHIDRFENLVRKHNSTIEIQHHVNKSLLDSALTIGKADTISFKKEIACIKKTNPSIIICTCSTYGEECDRIDDVQRIDEPIVKHLIKKNYKKRLVYTATSTKTISENLILKISSQLNKPIEIINCDCSEYWVHFEEGNIDLYESNIANKIKDIEVQVDVLFLAQASMEGAKKHLPHLNNKVFSSSEHGIITYLNII